MHENQLRYLREEFTRLAHQAAREYFSVDHDYPLDQTTVYQIARKKFPETFTDNSAADQPDELCFMLATAMWQFTGTAEEMRRYAQHFAGTGQYERAAAAYTASN